MQPSQCAEMQQLSNALLSAAAEHGVPNRFAPNWLAGLHNGPASFRIGALMRSPANFWWLRDQTAHAEEPFSFDYYKRGTLAGSDEAQFVCSPLAVEASHV